jgi:hypothetical protein
VEQRDDLSGTHLAERVLAAVDQQHVLQETLLSLRRLGWPDQIAAGAAIVEHQL